LTWRCGFVSFDGARKKRITEGTEAYGGRRLYPHVTQKARQAVKTREVAINLLEARGLHAAYGETRVLHGIDFVVRQGGVTALLGANGAGKTTTLRAICGLVRTRGAITLAGKSIDGMATEDIVRLGVAHVPEGRGTFMELTVEENMRLGAYTRPAREATADFEHIFGYFPRLKERYKQQAGTLSGGEQQMLAIARALLLRPRLLLLDEPSFGLAPLIVQEIFRILGRIKQDEGVSMLLVEQNAAIALQFSEHAYVLETGRIVMDGSSSEISEDEGIRRSYLGY
jgi:branched-chain amino acid transport system ATP-binding protein